MKLPLFPQRMRGLSLIEVMVAIVVLSFGIIGLALLHSRLAQAANDAKARSTAAHLASSDIESLRGFSDYPEYRTITDRAASTITVGGVAFTTTRVVERLRYDNDPNSDGNMSDAGFVSEADSEDLPEGPDLKRVTTTVTWEDSLGEERSIVLEDIISAANPRDGAHPTRPSMGPRVNPLVRIFKPTETGVIPIAIGTDEAGNNIASASSNPRPKQYADGATGSTKFTVQTYVEDGSNTNPLLQRQLDFAYASCACQEDALSTSAAPAYSPTYWDGERYTTPKEVIGKMKGRRNTSIDQDNLLCDTCCRDHQDKTGEVKMDPWRPATFADGTAAYSSGKHVHFNKGNTEGSLTASTTYYEACRLVRVNGIYQVATDTRLEHFDLLRLNRSSTGVVTLPNSVRDRYAEFVKQYVASAFARRSENGAYPVNGLPDALRSGTAWSAIAQAFEMEETSTYGGSLLFDMDGNNKWNIGVNNVVALNSRGIYIDWLSPEALEKLNCIGRTSDECTRWKTKNPLELIPFVAVNLTSLSGWSSSSTQTLTVRNDPVPLVRANGGSGGNNQQGDFIRGEAKAVKEGEATINVRMGRSNSGLINTIAVDPHDRDSALTASEQIKIGNTSAPPSSVPFRVTISDSTGDQNFSTANVMVKIIIPAVGMPECAHGTTSQTIHITNCLLDQPASAMSLEFSNYNFYTCSHLGNKWVYDSVNNRCVLPPSGKNGTPSYGTPSVRNYDLCSLVSPHNQITVGTPAVQGSGTATEKTVYSVFASAPHTLFTHLSAPPNPSFTATFRTSCN